MPLGASRDVVYPTAFSLMLLVCRKSPRALERSGLLEVVAEPERVEQVFAEVLAGRRRRSSAGQEGR
jgi:hypothetical protein